MHCCHLSMLLMVICHTAYLQQVSENILCQRKGFALDIVSYPKMCQSFPYVVVAFSLSLTQKIKAYHHTIFHASIWTTRFTNTSWHVKHVFHIEAMQGHATEWGWGKDQGKMWSASAGCIIANTTRKKSVSLLHCKTTYNLRMLHHVVCLLPARWRQ